jgi:hypothetical protein
MQMLSKPFSCILAPSQTPSMQRFCPSSIASPFSHHTCLRLHSISPPNAQRTEIPDRLVNILDAMFIDASSWKSSLAAYGI